MLTLKLFAVIAFAVALTAFAALGGGWKWHQKSGAGHVEHVAGWTWDENHAKHVH
jgi:hypothetical protein